MTHIIFSYILFHYGFYANIMLLYSVWDVTKIQLNIINGFFPQQIKGWRSLLSKWLCFVANLIRLQSAISLIAKFMRPIWGPSGADRTQVGPMLAPWTLLSGMTSFAAHDRKKVYLEITKWWKLIKNWRTMDVVFNSRKVHLNSDVSYRHHRYNKWNIKHDTKKKPQGKRTIGRNIGDLFSIMIGEYCHSNDPAL